MVRVEVVKPSFLVVRLGSQEGKLRWHLLQGIAGLIDSKDGWFHRLELCRMGYF